MPPKPAADPYALLAAAEAHIARLTFEISGLRTEMEALRVRCEVAETQADCDPLTGLVNRRAFARELRRAVAHCKRYGSSASLLFLDMDRFKQVNDALGHAGGDAALCCVADLLRRNVRESDVVGRLGGDEFAVLLINADAEIAATKAEALEQVIASAHFSCSGKSWPLRVSVGLRAYDPGQDAESWLAEADAAMFVRKRTERI